MLSTCWRQLGNSLEVPFWRLVISTNGALRRLMTYDNHPIPSNPSTYSIQSVIRYYVIRAQSRTLLWMFERENKYKTWASVFWEGQGRNREIHIALRAKVVKSVKNSTDRKFTQRNSTKAILHNLPQDSVKYHKKHVAPPFKLKGCPFIHQFLQQNTKKQYLRVHCTPAKNSTASLKIARRAFARFYNSEDDLSWTRLN